MFCLFWAPATPDSSKLFNAPKAPGPRTEAPGHAFVFTTQ